MEKVLVVLLLCLFISCNSKNSLKKEVDHEESIDAKVKESKLDTNGCMHLSELINLELYENNTVSEMLITNSLIVKNGLKFQINCHLKNIDLSKDQKLALFLKDLLSQKNTEIDRFHLLFYELNDLEKLRSVESFHLFLSLAKLDFETDYAHIQLPSMSQIGFRYLKAQIKTIDGLEFDDFIEDKIFDLEDDKLNAIKEEFGYGEKYRIALGKVQKQFKLELIENSHNMGLIKFKDYEK